MKTQDTRAALIAMTDVTTKDLLDMIEAFTDDLFIKKPAPDKWSAAEVAEHIWLSEHGVPEVWQGASHPANRDPEQHSDMIQKIFLDYTIQFKSPDFNTPTGKMQDKQELYQKLKQNREQMHALLETLELDAEFEEFELPNLGTLTTREWVVFVNSHARRHIDQMKRLVKEWTIEN